MSDDPAFICRSCGKRIIWGETKKGFRMPIDPEPVLAGNIILHERPHRAPFAEVVKADPNMKRFISHFVTCPQRKFWKGKHR